jgi:crotonobetainyl-CoA:carnitine CoA-transferase CaiB-like acyl-CoA transferase
MRANEVNPDPNTAVVVTAASLLGLLARESTGVGQQIFVDMFAANAYANFDDLVTFPEKSPRPSLGAGLRGPHPLYRLYQAKSGWVFLGLRTDQEWRRFREITGASNIDSPFAVSNVPLTDMLSELFATRNAAEWESLLAPVGLGCVQADACNAGEFFLQQCHEDSPWMVRVAHEELGDYYRHRPMVEFPNVSLQAGVRAGVDAESLLGELGYSSSDVDALFEQGVLWSSNRQDE